MRSFSHWSPQYLFNRTIEKRYRRLNPGFPWLTPLANTFLEGWLKPNDQGLEFGSGGSTLWFAGRIGHLTSVEHNPIWYEKTQRLITSNQLTNVDYVFSAKDEIGKSGPAYVDKAIVIKQSSLDFALVDGIYRDLCAEASIPKIKEGGILIIDNVNHFLPSASKAPNSVPLNGLPINSKWAEVHEVLKTWRKLWTSNGVSDTAIFFHP